MRPVGWNESTQHTMTITHTETKALNLARGSDQHTALITDDGDLSYDDLRERVAARRDELGATRRLVLIEASAALEPVVTYLASLEAGHPVLLVEPTVQASDGGPSSDFEPIINRADALIDRFDPDVIARVDNNQWMLHEARPGTRHELHPDLAMLASTSGSTGSPKVVRLSRENVLSNASAISEYLELGAHDRAITTLPLHYCYGLSVLNSHLVAGASVRLTSRSVVEAELWDDFEAVQATSFAGVPYTFELLEKTEFLSRELPSLRYVTQAGGRLDPERARKFIQLGRHRGFDFITMYGQTEATARMAYVPSDLAETAVGTIGVPIPGGQFRIDSPPSSDVGELVYTGPNVMMGYGHGTQDLALGVSTTELRTGDLARQRDDGLYEIVGRSNRLAKIYGLRIDLDHVEQQLDAVGLSVKAVSSAERLKLFVTTERKCAPVADYATSQWGLPAHSVEVHVVAEFPRTPSGKTDTVALLRFANSRSAAFASPAADHTAETLRARIAHLLGTPHAVIGDSFADLGGDSLSYVEVSLHLEELVGVLPRTWPTMSMVELAEYGAQRRAVPSREIPRSRRRLTRIEVPIVLRAVAIVLIVATHGDLFFLQGGAHLLLVIAGYNLARFHLTNRSDRLRTRAMLASVASLAIPAIVWIGCVTLVASAYATATVFLVNNFVGSPQWTSEWRYWFLEAMLWSILLVVVLLAIPAVRRWERRWPFAFALAILALTLVVRTVALGGVHAEGTEMYALSTVAWCIALGWVIARIATRTQRLLVSALSVVCVISFFGQPLRAAIVIGGVLLLLWVTSLPAPRWLVGIIATLAGASFFTYLTHWQVYPGIETYSPLLATLASLVVGLLVWKFYTFIVSRARTLVRKATTDRAQRHHQPLGL
ncbi:acyl-CoA synthetase (AMP-forming)/AMP-acid ligase II [Rhodoglobus vestalii]|uniref:Acyl-CoA synthetase (AMP-forming)/AMP-acid ligase II n=2 Tax=Rhodoglobus vestalii TaxID=193384 RepID=A0A8H2K6F7_9MICO|nr:acyl-CoA synthetase (AMP-forming)/AMP-acid ligase II [Rhodoglobus vestalii]